MATKRPPKKGKPAAKKATAKGGVAKKTTLPKATAKPFVSAKGYPDLNKLRLEGDKAYFESQIKKYGWDYEAIDKYAIPQYIPIHEGKKIVAYRNSYTGERVSPYYRNKVFGRYFRGDKLETEEEIKRANIYAEATQFQRKSRARRHYNLVASYQLRNPDMSVNQVLNDPTFNSLVQQLEVFHTGQYSFSSEQWTEMLEYAEGYPGRDVIQEQQAQLSREMGENADYQHVLFLLGRRLPGDTNPVGESDPNHIKNTVAPYYEALFHGTDFSEGEE
jgi:hypothetical protein